MPSFTDAGYIEDYMKFVGEAELQKDKTGREYLRLFGEYKKTFGARWKKRWPWLTSESMETEKKRRKIVNMLLQLMSYREEDKSPAHIIEYYRGSPQC